jgi:asparagine synthase (glutamine-hydrolysing)
MMSIQFGRWNFEGQPPAPDYIEKVNATLASCGPDSNESYSKGGVRVLYRAFHTTRESHWETQPHISPSGDVITWDGRLDNRTKLIGEIRDSLTISSTDIAIVVAAYEKWGTACFAKLIGDWALSVWSPKNCWLILAKDPIGTRHLYYSIDKTQVTWSTLLDPIILFAGKTFALNEEYIAGWFSYFPAAHLTPYVGIRAVQPSSFIILGPGKHSVSKYWDFNPDKRIRHGTDAEYEEHFRTVFGKAVQRRLRSDSPVLAELSGGMDSSSIVCVADRIIASGEAETPRLDTISWYDDEYPALDERPYFSKIEERRGRTGYHIDLNSLKAIDSRQPFDSSCFAPTPIPRSWREDFSKNYAQHMSSQGHFVTLSGIGGDDFTGGGVPTPRPELQNLIARAQFLRLAHQLNTWAVKMRKHRLPLLWEAIRGFVPPALAAAPADTLMAAWFHPGFVHRNKAALCGYPYRMKLFGSLPSFQDNLRTLDKWRAVLGCVAPHPKLLREVRYPYLDRDFLEFMCAIPREQIVGVGRRRYLMRRALVGIVPDELLNRRDKAFVPPDPKKDSSNEWAGLMGAGQQIVSNRFGIIDSDRFWEAIERPQRNDDVSVRILMRTLMLESWLRHLILQRVLTEQMSTKDRGDFFLARGERKPAHAHAKSSAS